MEKLFIKARGGEKIAVIIDRSNNSKGLVFVLHGLGSSKDSDYIKAFAQAFSDKDFTVIRFDHRHSNNESEGEYKDVNFTNTYQDLEDVINWAKSQDWYREPFVLSGHSMGAGCAIWYAVNNPKKVLALASISTVIGGRQTLDKFKKEDLTAYVDNNNLSFKNRILLEIQWYKFKKDILNYNLFPEVSKVNIPIIMIVGEKDINTPLEDQMKVYNAVSGDKEIHVIKEATHTFREANHLAEIASLLKNWIDNKVLK